MTANPGMVQYRYLQQLFCLSSPDLFALAQAPTSASRVAVKRLAPPPISPFLTRALLLQAGNLYENYDTVTSTEGFYAGVSNSSLKFVPPSKDPPKIKDNVREGRGGGKGRDGRTDGACCRVTIQNATIPTL